MQSLCLRSADITFLLTLKFKLLGTFFFIDSYVCFISYYILCIDHILQPQSLVKPSLNVTKSELNSKLLHH